MQFRLGGAGGGAFIGCGAVIALFGLILLTPVGVWLVKAVGWMSVVLGLVIVATGVCYWLRGRRGRDF
jgi:hypothetical protein